MVKIKIEQTVIKTVNESDVIKAIFSALNENGLHFSKAAVKEEINSQRDRLWTTGDCDCLVLADANVYVSMMLEAINEVCFSESSTMYAEAYADFSFPFKYVVLGR